MPVRQLTHDHTDPDPWDVVFVVPTQQPTALDLVGPWEVFSRWMGVRRVLAASTPGLTRCDTGMSIEVPTALAEVSRADVIVVPGTSSPFEAAEDKVVLDWLAEMAPRARWVTSVCTGSLVLARAGLLAGRRATTHFALRETLAGLGVDVADDRVVTDGSYVTSAGVSAGIDMALTVSLLELGQPMAEAVQLSMEYDPKPPVDSGSVEKASPEVRAFVVDMFAHMVDALRPATWPNPGAEHPR